MPAVAAATDKRSRPEVSELRMAERLRVCLKFFCSFIYRENLLLATQEKATKSPEAFIFSSVVLSVLRD